MGLSKGGPIIEPVQWGIESSPETFVPRKSPLERATTVEAIEEVMRIGHISGPPPLEPGEPGYPFQALVDRVQAHVQEHGGRFRIAEGSVTYECGHVLPAAVAIDVTRLAEERHADKVRSAFVELAAQPCAECARLEKLS